jgi:hypothetical protein
MPVLNRATRLEIGNSPMPTCQVTAIFSRIDANEITYNTWDAGTCPTPGCP